MSDFPFGTATYGQTELHRTGNGCVSTLTAGIDAVTTSFTVASISTKTTWPTTNFFVHIHLNGTNDEWVFVPSRVGTTVSGAVRGLGGAPAVSHASGEEVEIVEMSELIYFYGAHIKALEEWAGSGFNDDTNTQNYTLHRTTTDATQTELTIDGGTPTSSNRIPTSTNFAYILTGTVVCVDSSGAPGGWKIDAVAVNNAGTLSISGPALPKVDNVFRSVEAWAIDISATGSTFTILVTGNAANTIEWSFNGKLHRVRI